MPQSLTQTQSHIKNSSPKSGNSVYVKMIKNVLDFDFPQALKAWEALKDAGIEPGELVINGLNQGHGYKIETFNIRGSINFKNQPQVLGESLTSEKALISYQIIEFEDWQRLIVSEYGQSQSLITLSENQLVETTPVKQQALSITAIFKKEDDMVVYEGL